MAFPLISFDLRLISSIALAIARFLTALDSVSGSRKIDQDAEIPAPGQSQNQFQT
ncbi:MAG: hypothetical protein JSR96_02850 [Proteobacteria bacterium]|nr:hypothetical protein [Pseudomonadota bacterium]